jgi:hypothetical protein
MIHRPSTRGLPGGGWAAFEDFHLALVHLDLGFLVLDRAHVLPARCAMLIHLLPLGSQLCLQAGSGSGVGLGLGLGGARGEAPPGRPPCP